jgi:predicted aspartyl protease
MTGRMLAAATTGENTMHKGWMLALLAASSVIGPVAVAKDSSCKLTKYTTVELDVGRIVQVPVKVNATDAWMSLNTGSALSVVYAAAATRLGLPLKKLPPNMPAISAGGVKVDQVATVDSLQVGSVRFSRTELLVMPTEVVTYKGAPIIGVMGMDTFSQADVELDLAHGTLSLFSQEHCPGAVYWSDTAASVPMQRGRLGNLYFPMELEGKHIQTTLATGQAESSLHTDVSKRVFNFDEHSPENEVQTTSGRERVYFRAMKLTNPGFTVTNAKIELVGPAQWCQVDVPIRSGGAVGYDGCYGVYPLSLGLSVLKKLHLYFATKEHMLYFTSADSAEQARPTAGPTDAPQPDH